MGRPFSLTMCLLHAPPVPRQREQWYQAMAEPLLLVQTVMNLRTRKPHCESN